MKECIETVCQEDSIQNVADEKITAVFLINSLVQREEHLYATSDKKE